ncbi:MAG: hypothetical protein ACYTGP_12960 [Planctomycetota bacterium]|jgi:tellurite resistance protein TehA-like permease
MPRIVPAREPSDAIRITGTGLLAVVCLLLGIAARLMRPLFVGVHWEALVGFILLGVLCVVSVIVHRRIPWRRALLTLEVQVATIWLTFVVGWSFVEKKFWSDLLGVAAGWWLACAIVSPLLLVAIQRVRQPTFDPNVCRYCGYDLTGQAQTGAKCPECGRE